MVLASVSSGPEREDAAALGVPVLLGAVAPCPRGGPHLSLWISEDQLERGPCEGALAGRNLRRSGVGQHHLLLQISAPPHPRSQPVPALLRHSLWLPSAFRSTSTPLTLTFKALHLHPFPPAPFCPHSPRLPALLAKKAFSLPHGELDSSRKAKFKHLLWKFLSVSQTERLSFLWAPTVLWGNLFCDLVTVYLLCHLSVCLPLSLSFTCELLVIHHAYYSFCFTNSPGSG